MKKHRSLLALILSLLILVLTGCAQTDGTPSQDEPAEIEKTGDIVILYTSDVHCGVADGFGYAGLWQVREYFLSRGDEVFLVDDGDSIQGTPLGMLDKGETCIELMNAMKYDVAIPGNHEFDYTAARFLELADKAEFPYISCNLYRNGEHVFQPYIILEAAGKKIAFIGVTTPETLHDSDPECFKNEAGETEYDFCQDGTGEKLYAEVQTQIDAARAEGADYVYLLAHLGNEGGARPWTYADVVENTEGIDVVLDGHSHDTDQVEMKDKAGNKVLRSACGTKLANIGWSRITADGSITTGLYTWNNGVTVPDMFCIENDIGKLVDEKLAKLEQELGNKVGVSYVDLTIYDPVEVDSAGQPIRMVRRAETNFGDFCADALRVQTGADIGVINGGAIRKNINAGDITMNDILSVMPFSNQVCVLEVSGQQILDMLEWGARAIPGEGGAFMQVSGMTYEVHSNVPSPCLTDEGGNYNGISGERRVRNVMVGGEPLDPEKKYTIAGSDYLLMHGGDGMTVLSDATVIHSGVKLDNEVLLDYIVETLGGEVGEEYADPYGEGRIVIIED